MLISVSRARNEQSPLAQRSIKIVVVAVVVVLVLVLVLVPVPVPVPVPVLVLVLVLVLVVVVVAATDHRRQCSFANQARGANSRGSQQAPFLKRKGCPTD